MGLAATATAVVASVLPESLAFAAPIIVGGVAGAGLGALGSAITGGDPGEGALFGGLTGGVTGGLGELVGGAAGVGGAGSAGGSAASAAAPVAGVAADTPVDLASAAAGGGGGALDAATISGGATGFGDVGAAAGGGGALDAATISGGATGAAGADASSALSALGAGGGGGGVAAAAPIGAFDASGQLVGASPDIAGAGVSGGATGFSAAPLSSANIAGGAGSSGSFLDKIVSGAGSSISKNPLGIGLAGAGLLKDIAGQKQDPNAKALANQAAALNAQIGQLESPLTSGQLPPGAQSAVTQGVASAKAAIRAKYASLGLSGSTMETQDLANIDMQAQTQVFQIAGDLFSKGIQGAQLSEQIYKDLLGANTAQNTATGQAIANLSAALSGGGSVNTKGLTINLPGQQAAA